MGTIQIAGQGTGHPSSLKCDARFLVQEIAGLRVHSADQFVI
jgi:hypothetical protein